MWTIYKPFTLGRPFDDSFFDCFMRDWTEEDMQQAVAFAVPININNVHGLQLLLFQLKNAYIS